ncbi:MAG: hypothetical protein OCD00_16475 [Colwellia sp.]
MKIKNIPFNLKSVTLVLVMISSQVLSSQALANENDVSINQQFKAAYHSYQDAVETQDNEAQIIFAEQSLQLGKKLYGKSSINTANQQL